MTFLILSRRALFGGATLLGPLLRSNTARPADPVFAAIATARRTGASLTAALSNLDEDDEAQNRQANVAADADSDARNALGKVMPTTKVNRSGFPGGHLVWVRRPRVGPWPEHSRVRRPRLVKTHVNDSRLERFRVPMGRTLLILA